MRISRRASVIVLLCMGFWCWSCNRGWYDVSSRGWKTELTAADRKKLARLMQVFDSIICEESIGTTADLKHCYQYHARKIAEQGDTVITLGLPDHFADAVVQVLVVELVGKIWSIEGMTTNRSRGKSVDTWCVTG